MKAVLLAAGALAVAIPFAVAKGYQQEIGSDFAVFWQAGRNFASGSPLYHDYLPGARPFKYPPFAAMVFQLLGIFPLKTAASLFSLLNLVLWPVSILLVGKTLGRLFPQRKPGPVPLALAVVFSVQFWQDNFQHAQMNELVFVLVLLGIHNYLRGKDVAAAAGFVAAAAIKVTPVFFLAWLLIRGRRRALAAAVALGLASIAVPLLLRGPATGVADLAEYYQGFLAAQPGAEGCSYQSCQNLDAMLTRMMRPSENPEHLDYRFLPASAPAERITYLALWAVVLLLFLATLVRLRVGDTPLSALEFALPMLTGLLLSPITFKAHLVSLLFAYGAFLSIPPALLSTLSRRAAMVITVAIVVTGLSGRDLVGNTLSSYVSGYSLFVWTVLLLFLFAVTQARNERLSSPGPG
ncbi:MAG: glycosyltransferase family 87 protein [Gemmatimonadales bacterium]